ncbi:DMT family transporter [Niveispirillum cyanobacteriorum]|uniref:EamA family transporter n=1 Tax=Niveispirillum cyanobacteriorum TaxID=1612173 RepID=A0A2K9NCS4_9PROT|nr:DMT family transporter [Niveispirillum cyanobacteriorum]AUN30918.1 EamA family transporter [Niveispirillum cyanobacteriorum]GGE80802.1 membrane protein [Niveispirillum cyanobacteriorum]
MPDTSPPTPVATKKAHLVTRPMAVTLLVLVILLWGVNWPVMKQVVGHMPPISFVASRLLLGAVSLLIFTAARRQLRLPSRADLPVILSVGGLQMGVFTLLVTIAVQYVPAGRAGILAYTTPLWVVPLALIFLKEKVGWAKAGGLLVGLSGVAVLFNPAAFDWTQRPVLLGNGLLMLAALIWACNIVHVRRHRWVGTPLQLAPWQMMLAASMATIAALAMEDQLQIDWSGQLVVLLIYNGPIATAFCFWAMVTVNRALPAITTSLSVLGVPVVGLLSSALWLREPLTMTNLAGLGLIGGGLMLVALSERRT